MFLFTSTYQLANTVYQLDQSACVHWQLVANFVENQLASGTFCPSYNCLRFSSKFVSTLEPLVLEREKKNETKVFTYPLRSFHPFWTLNTHSYIIRMD